MTKEIKLLIGAGVVSVLLIVALLIVGGRVEPSVGGEVHNTQETFDEGIAVDGTERISGTGGGSFTTLTASGATNVEGFTTGGTATALTDANGGTYTLTEAQLLAAGTFAFAAGGAGQEVIALTMPATSTMTTLIPNAGDCREWLYDASALAAATTTTMTLGTGHNIIAYTTNDDVIDGAEFAGIKMCRRSDTDVNTIVTELLHAD